MLAVGYMSPFCCSANGKAAVLLQELQSCSSLPDIPQPVWTDHCVVTPPLLVTSAPCSLFKRLDEKVAAAAMGSDARAALRRFARRLRSVSEEMRAHAATLAAFEGTPGEEWEALAAKRRCDLTAEFFEFLQTLAAAAGDNTARREGAPRPISQSPAITPQGMRRLQLPAITWLHEACCWPLQKLSVKIVMHADCRMLAWVCHATQEVRSHVFFGCVWCSVAI